MTAARYAQVREAIRGAVESAARKHGLPEAGIAAAWPDGSPEDRARLAAELAAEFGCKVEIVAGPEDASEAGRAAIPEARRARLESER